MLYTSERNWGCRFLEISVFGYRAVILENEKIRTTFLLDKGSEIIEFNFKEKDADFIWRSPLGLSCLKKMEYAQADRQMLTDRYTGGWFECFPNVGGPCTYKGADLPHYGEVCYLPWEYSVLKDEPEEVALKCFLRTTKTPYLVEKVFSVKTGVPTLFIEEKVRNTGREDLHFQWGHHPNFGSNLIDGSCILEVPDCSVRVHYSAPGSRLAEGSTGEWPFMEGKNGEKVDLRKVQPPDSGVCEVYDLNDLKEGYTSVMNPTKGIGMRLDWDLGMFPHSVVWHVCNHDGGYPRYGDTYVLGFIPRNDKVWGLENSAGLGHCPIIKAGETKTTWMSISALAL